MSEIQIETIDQIYNKRLKKYFDYCWIQQSILQNVASKRFKKAKN